MNDAHLQMLFDKYHSGTLDEEERAELERTLLSSAAARQAFWEHARFHALLARWGQEEWGRRIAAGEVVPPPQAPPVLTSPKTSVRKLNRRWLPWVAAAACALFAGIALWNWSHTADEQQQGSANVMPRAAQPIGIAVLATAVDAKWADMEALAPGAVVPAGKMSLASGVVQLEFYSGARLIIEGPAVVELKSEMELFCHAGRLRASVPPPARGFTVAAPGLSVVDLGTEFGVHVPSAGPAEVHVFTGMVQVPRDDAPAPLKLVAGEAARVAGAALTRIPVDREGFLDERELARRASGDVRRRQMAWRNAAAGLDADPAAIGHFTFDSDDSATRTVANSVTGGGRATAASVVGCGWSDGRWPAYRAVEFKNAGDRIRLNAPGSWRAVTLLGWVRIDALPNHYHALLAPDGLAEGTLRWGLSQHGELRLAIAKPSGKGEPSWEVVISPPVVTPNHFGQWLMLAATFDGETVRHFVDGQVVKTGRAFSPAPLLIGPAEVGNWRGPSPRYLQGRIDELAILSRALTPDEISELYAAGQP